MRNIRQTLEQGIKTMFAQFLNTFSKNGSFIYRIKAEDILKREQHLMVISSIDLMSFSNQMWDVLTQDYYKFEPHLNEALTHFMRDIERNSRMEEEDKNQRNDKTQYYYVGFDNIYGDELRSLKCHKLGQLTAFKGTVTRTTQVRPQLIKGVFKCLGCQLPSEPIEQQFKYTEPKKCQKANCVANKWQLLPALSQFSDFQKIRVQDDPSELPEGGMPRSFQVILRNDLCDTAQPGDTCIFTGMLCVVPDISSMLKPGQKTQVIMKNTENKGNAIGMQGVTGLKQTGVKDLNYKLSFIAGNIKIQNQQFKHEVNEQEQEESTEYSDENQIKRIFSLFTSSSQAKISEIMSNPNKYEALAESLFPSIYGHSEIKKAVLLQLFSGVNKISSANKISIRGDLNVLIVGDPSTAKSMFLKSVESFVPRSVYTNGKTTSAAGLTATVTRDENGDVGLEAGALMLADNGVCCIDEFDKMDVKDQVAIHEAMQQQTISIAKAGIYATLNARTSILAAANPLFGRYDKSKPLKHNINISAPLMSRFDLFFVICDQPDVINDTSIGQFILSMHRNQQKALERVYESHQIKQYIRFARKIKPRLTVQSADLLRKCYRELRNKDKDSYSSYRVTVRQLESMIRLSEALARLNLSFEVLPEHVQEAYRLISLCIVKLEKSSVDLDDEEEIVQKMRGLTTNDDNNRSNIVQKQLKEKKVQRRQISLSYQAYTDFQRNIIELFSNKERQLQAGGSQQPFGMQQSDIVDYLLGLQVDSLNSLEQMQKARKIITSVIRKLIDNERMLVVLNDDQDLSKRILHLHPNYVG